MSNLRHIFAYYRFKVAQRVTNRRTVLELRDPSRLDRRKLSGDELLLFSNFRSIPEGVVRELVVVFGESYLCEVQELFQSASARLAVLMVGERLGAISWICSGADIPRWLIPLSDDDLVFSRGFTVPAFRGRGFYARCIAFTYDSIASPSNRFLADCHVYNTASIRQFKRSGFETIM